MKIKLAWFGACSERASCVSGASMVSCFMRGTTPTVDSVMCLGDSLNIRLSDIPRIEASTAS